MPITITTAACFKNGNVLLLCAAELPVEVARRIKGGMAGTEENGKIGGRLLVGSNEGGR